MTAFCWLSSFSFFRSCQQTSSVPKLNSELQKPSPWSGSLSPVATHTHRTSVQKWVAKVPKAKLLKATVTLHGGLSLSTALLNLMMCIFVQGGLVGLKKKFKRQWTHCTDCVSLRDPQSTACIISTCAKKTDCIRVRVKVHGIETAWGAESKYTYGCHQSGWWWCPGRCSVERGAPSSLASRPAEENWLSGSGGGSHQLGTEDLRAAPHWISPDDVSQLFLEEISWGNITHSSRQQEEKQKKIFIKK